MVLRLSLVWLLAASVAASAAASAAVSVPAATAAPPSPANAASVEAGRRLFARCAGCHEVGPRARNVFGPQLNGVLGRTSGSAPGYTYSEAIRRRALVWNDTNLEAFIRDPDAVVPGTKMRFFGFFSQRQMSDLIAYLRANPAPAARGANPTPVRTQATPGAAR